MTMGSVVVVLYWVIFTIRRGFTPKLNLKLKANMYDRKGTNEEARKAAEIAYYPLHTAEWLLRIAGWVENILLIALVAWLIYFIGALLTGSFIVLGYPA